MPTKTKKREDNRRCWAFYLSSLWLRISWPTMRMSCRSVKIECNILKYVRPCGTFNHLYGDEIFRLPKPRLVDGAAKVPGTDGQKMSKSYGNTIEVFEDLPAQKKKIMRITTDSRPMEEPKDPQQDHLYQLLSLVGSEKEVAEMRELYRRGGFGYGDVKKAVVVAAKEAFAAARERRFELESNPSKIDEILAVGAERARTAAGDVLERAREACGLRGASTRRRNK